VRGISFRSGYQLNPAAAKRASGVGVVVHREPPEPFAATWIGFRPVIGGAKNHTTSRPQRPGDPQEGRLNHVRPAFKATTVVWLNDKPITDVMDKPMVDSFLRRRVGELQLINLQFHRPVRAVIPGKVRPERPHPNAVDGLRREWRSDMKRAWFVICAAMTGLLRRAPGSRSSTVDFTG
jgi:hypothetical protein